MIVVGCREKLIVYKKQFLKACEQWQPNTGNSLPMKEWNHDKFLKFFFPEPSNSNIVPLQFHDISF